ncbi:heat shock 70 kDa protein 12A-like [Girardinichthys multiradiatus]|uniref:heat shock 70 kDa protein 12A-like n=1 Tax=Girardinichthys multiradiatus TaxID=208333 RepID=UPI001FACA31D|nr:heat shock 70 kDa protein 12A-like [Girardinichthys multiradiatus]
MRQSSQDSFSQVFIDLESFSETLVEKVGLETSKTPTCILFDENQQFVSFGYKARQTYLKKNGRDSRAKFFFDCFKMSLYDKKITTDLTIKAANGKEMKALKVFTEALRFLKDDALKTIAKNTEGRKFLASDFTWVLTVPAIWDLSAKQFMREAATQAGIMTDGTENNLVIALEPEAASVYCKKLPSEGFVAENLGENKLDRSPGTRYIIVDCGGGTIDITVHKVLKRGVLKELHKASGNNLGGQTVDRKFKEFLRDTFSAAVWDEYEKNYPSEVQRIMYDFTLFKKCDDDVEIICPLNLGMMAQKKQNIEEYFKRVQGASWNEGSIKITKQTLRSFFEDSLWSITRSLRGILSKRLNIEYILLVGGFAESQILQRYITDEFIDDCKVLCPITPQEAIMKGAVEFGRNQGVVASRKSAYTYGVSLLERFNESIHRADKKYTNKEGDFCRDIFGKLVEIDEDVGWNETREHFMYPIERDQTQITLAFYRTKKKKLTYVDEPKVEEIGSFVVQSPDTTLGMEREIDLEIKFGSTEMTATATDKESGSVHTVILNFMSSGVKPTSRWCRSFPCYGKPSMPSPPHRLNNAERNYDDGDRELLAIKAGTKNAKPLSTQFAGDESVKEPAPILPPNWTVGALRWEMEDVIHRAPQQEPDPGTGPPNHTYVPLQSTNTSVAARPFGTPPFKPSNELENRINGSLIINPDLPRTISLAKKSGYLHMTYH